MSSRLPITIITGFLGTGKTTLLRHLLTKSDQRLAVMVNEFGTVGLDGDLIRSCGFCPEEEIGGRLVELNNGCLCCTVQDDFLPTIEILLARSNDLDGIVIETSGLALPRPLLQALEWPAIRTRVRVNGVVTLVDGEALAGGSPIGDIVALERQRDSDPSVDHLTPVEELFEDQLASADIVLISRTDRILEVDIEKVKSHISSMVSKGTPLIPLSFGEIDPALILGEIRVDLNELNQSVDELVDSNTSHHDHTHVDMISETIRLEGKFERSTLENALSLLATRHNMIRIKGRAWLLEKDLPLQIQMVGSRLSSWFESSPEGTWKPSQTGFELVLIGFAIEDLELFCSDLKNLVF